MSRTLLLLFRRLKRRPVPAAPSESLRVERVLAMARALLALTSVAVLALEPLAPGRFTPIAHGLLLTYSIHALLIVVHLRSGRSISPGLRIFIHVVDVVWATSVALLSDSPRTPFFAFFVFIILAAAYRWSLREALLTAAASIGALVGEAIVLPVWPSLVGEAFIGDFEMSHLLFRGTYLLTTAGLLGYLADAEKKLRVETSVIARIMGNVQATSGLSGSVQAVMEDVVLLFGTRRVLLAAKETDTNRVYLWEPRPVGTEPRSHNRTEDESGLHDTYFFPMPGHAWHVGPPLFNRRGNLTSLVLDEHGSRLHGARLTLPTSFRTVHSFRRLMCVSGSVGDEWSCRLFLFDPRIGTTAETGVHFLQTLARQVGPAIYSVYLVRRLRARASQLERSRVARELHDGTIQSLVGLEMQLEALRRQAGRRSKFVEEVTRIQSALHTEVLNLRELMQHMKALDVDAKHLVEFLAEVVDRFRRETRIAARFECDLDEVNLPPRVCREIARIVQEGLVNIRKHSAAHHVTVRFAFESPHWTLTIDDDGRGFSFSGRLSQGELESTSKGPAVIKERVRSIKGELTIESNPGRGARVTVLIPQAAHAYYVG